MAKYRYGFLKKSDKEIAQEEAEVNRAAAYWEKEVQKSTQFDKKENEAFKKFVHILLLIIILGILYMAVKGHR